MVEKENKKIESLYSEANKKLIVVNWFFALIVVATYIFYVISGQKSIFVGGIIIAISLGGMVLATYIYSKDKSNMNLKYYMFITFYVIWSYTFIANPDIVAYAFAAPFILTYALYSEKRMINIATAGVVSSVIVKIIVEVNNRGIHGWQILSYIVMISVLLLFFISVYSVTGIFIKNYEKSNEDLEKILEAQEKQKEVAKTVEDILQKVSISSAAISNIMNEISQSSTIVSNAIEEVSKGAKETTDEIQSETEHIHNIEFKINDSVTACNLMNTASKDTADVVNEGVSIVNELNDETKILADDSSEVTKLMNELQEESEKISDIILLISDIAEQINLLALNASIEAARAGEAGKGFAVVASEVSSLADSSKQSTEEIADIIKRLIEKADKSSEVVKKLNNRTINHSKLVYKTNEIFNSINNNISGIMEKNISVKSTIQVVSEANKIISDSIANVSAISEETLANTENTVVMSEEHIKQAEKARELVDELMSELEKLRNL